MIDTYFDRADAATGYVHPLTKPVNHDDPRYWNGELYDSMISRMAAQARYELAHFIDTRCMQEKEAMTRSLPRHLTLDFGVQRGGAKLRIREAFSQEWILTLTDFRTNSDWLNCYLKPGLYFIEFWANSSSRQILNVDTRRTSFVKLNRVPADA